MRSPWGVTEENPEMIVPLSVSQAKKRADALAKAQYANHIRQSRLAAAAERMDEGGQGSGDDGAAADSEYTDGDADDEETADSEYTYSDEDDEATADSESIDSKRRRRRRLIVGGDATADDDGFNLEQVAGGNPNL